MKRVFIFLITLSVAAVCCLGKGKGSAESEKPEWSVRGAGFFQDRKLKQQLELIFSEEATAFDASNIEDAALILISYLEEQSFLAAKAIATITHADGSVSTVEWDGDFDVFLPRDTSAKAVAFDLQKGISFYYDELKVEGSDILDTEEVEEFFYSAPLMFQSETVKLFTPSLLNGGAANLQAHLNGLGYQQARVESRIDSIDEESGACVATIMVDEGPLHVIDKVVLSIDGEEAEEIVPTSEYVGQTYSRFIAQDLARELRNFYFNNGYPDVALKSSLKIGDESGEQVRVSLFVDILPGSKVIVDGVDYRGSEDTKRSLIESRLELKEGDVFNPSLLESSRLGLARLGVFDRVTYEVESIDEGRRAIHFDLLERTNWNVDTILGWGSYEQLRGGVLVEKVNMFGLGHRARFKGIASMKSHLGEARYLIPEVFGTPTSVSAKVFALERDERAFKREDFGLDIGMSRKFDGLSLDVDTIYSIKSLDLPSSNLADDLANQGESTVGSLELRIGRDRRDNALNPREGYRFFGRFEWASEALGGEVDYQRAEIGLSYHDEISRGLFWHGGLTHGAIHSFSESDAQIPAGALFYPGGENSVRGYQRSGASPLSEGKFLGARSYVLLNLELEQALSDSLSLVAFVDALGTASRIDDYPLEDTLSSAGIGLRLKTFMGPVRLEYGYNLEPRPGDPAGTLHFALGYPF